jgi:lysophospholipase L1-like esterase
MLRPFAAVGGAGRKNMRALIAVAIGLALVTTGSQTLAATPTPIVYLALGDSLAVGIGASSVAETAYVPRLFHYFHGTSHGGVDTLLNLGIGGDTSYWFLSGIPGGAGPQLGQALAAIDDRTTDTRVVTLDIGGNDLLNTLFRDPACLDIASVACRAAMAATLAAFATNYQIILTALNGALAADPGTERVFVMTYYNLWGGTGDPLEAVADAVLLGSDLAIDCAANLGDATKVGLNDLIACIGIANGAEIADGFGAVGDNALHLTHVAEGDIHPTDAGYAAIASAFMEAEKR